jgi:hypothetical protein
MTPNKDELLKVAFDSGKRFVDSAEKMDDFNKSIGRRKPNGPETVMAGIMFTELLINMMVAFRDLDSWVNA